MSRRRSSGTLFEPRFDRHQSIPANQSGEAPERDGAKIRLGKLRCLAQGETVNDPGAHVLREATGTSGLEQTAQSAAAALARCDIPHLLVGGLAVQEHGYHRVTLDVDVVVPDVLEAVEFLTPDLSGLFARVPGCEDRVQDRRNGVFVDLLPAGKVLRQGCGVPFPEPTVVSEQPRFVSLEQLP